LLVDSVERLPVLFNPGTQLYGLHSLSSRRRKTSLSSITEDQNSERIITLLWKLRQWVRVCEYTWH